MVKFGTVFPIHSFRKGLHNKNGQLLMSSSKEFSIRLVNCFHGYVVGHPDGRLGWLFLFLGQPYSVF